MKGWTYGAELELSDWPRAEELPDPKMGIDLRDVTMVNSNGVAVDPLGLSWHEGGEIQTRPTDDPHGQGQQLQQIMHRWPLTTVNYRSNLHIHVRVPGLRENLMQLKMCQAFIHEWMPKILPILDPIPKATATDYPVAADLKAARRREARRRVSHHKLLRPERLERQLAATTLEEFFELEVPTSSRGDPMWHASPRLCVNLRQLRETDTIEFRHFPGTIDPMELYNCVLWVQYFTEVMVGNENPEALLERHGRGVTRWPMFGVFDPWMERGYEHTSIKFHPRVELAQRIEDWLQGRVK